MVDAQTKRDVDRFRRAERARLYGLRKTMRQTDRAAQTAAVTHGLDEVLGNLSGAAIAAYWPIRGELDLRPWLARVHAAGGRVALPVVVERGEPVEFHLWTPDGRMKRGDWNIPVPADGETLRPEVVIVPLVGVDDACFRLGNGGGYYDMTLAALARRPRILAVGQDFCRLPSIYPQPWDVRMDVVILGDGTIRHAPLST